MATEMMKAVLVEEGAPLKLGDFEKPDLKPGEVLVKVAASGLNRADLVQRRGAYPPPPGASPIMGLEISGTVVATSDSANRFKLGDRVAGLLAGGGYAEFAAVDEGSLFPVPDDMDMVKAACFPEALMTVWANVFDRVGFQTGEAFLCHGGTSGIGVMALQMAKIAGASKIYATAGSAEKCALATELGADRAINYKTEDFEKIIKEEGGVDVTLDMVGGDYIQKNISVSRPDGRIINIAYMNGFTAEVNFAPVLMKRLTLAATTLRARPVEEKRRIRDAVEKDFWPQVISGDIRPVLEQAFPVAEAEAAQALMAKGGHSGKIVLVW
ncbi:NAD(P)H-quinone oxidoreductase [uncultured Hyphomonas sp.]|jgi:putative PIG3 family NAD(P)H quinone oxidoreductase|uniref:NAD(P)H-quinone oxidoreductase n=1 Tax=uncultured Hyphomonas sp. TaxID=225298 RepID=UPI000C5B78A1|nr:NAD(P)H-quinone oxidoreductase [Hyphomonadaceae bacterium]|tara:strand:+ start:8934 stop:9911 length:978 start_codon:yes stop_codon:yes gene_type:complete